MLKRLQFIALMLICLATVSVSAQTGASPEKQAAIRELIALINGDNKLQETMDAMAPQIQAQQNASMKSLIDSRTDISDAEKKRLADSFAADKRYSVARLMNKVTQKINYNEVLNQILVEVYDKNYTLEEVLDMTTFYRTPTGRKVLKMMTPVSVDTMRLINEKLFPTMMLAIKELIDEDQREIEQKLGAPNPKP